MIVVDASVAVLALLNAGVARDLLQEQPVHVPHLIDSEVVSGLRSRVLGRRITAENGLTALRVWSKLGVIRYPLSGLLERVWELRENVSAYDAGYVALAENLSCSLVTADSRLARASGILCAVTLVPN
ncbi:MAG: VapC toxin family PIN domain ribonuclease [Candidatus Dormiibacter spiritus]|nr:MAG: VapC toxin family PIN domain ribonuclease [Candidatus Dormibacteraeota bacterium]